MATSTVAEELVPNGTPEDEDGEYDGEDYSIRREARVTLVGTQALLMSNVQMADPDYEYARAVKEITKKGKTMTEEDRRRKYELEWRGALYLENGRVVVPSANILRMLAEAGKLHKQGTAVQRALSMPQVNIPLTYMGSKEYDAALRRAGSDEAARAALATTELERLKNSADFRDQRIVNLNPTRKGGGKGPRRRPRFMPWALQFEIVLDTEALSWADFENLLDLAGRIEGQGDGRRIGYGRFRVEEVKAL